MHKAKVIIIDDHTLFREGLESLLRSRDIEVVASLGDGREGAEPVNRLRPDAVLLDVRMPGVDGIKVLGELIRQDNLVPVIVLTTSRSEKDFTDAMRGGARGYFLKDMEPDRLVSALHSVISGNIEVAPEMRDKYEQIIAHGVETAEGDPVDNLTPREKEVFHLLAEGQSNKLIAEKLGISDGTVKLHVKSILKKLNMRSRVEAAIFAVERERQDAVRTGY